MDLLDLGVYGILLGMWVYMYGELFSHCLPESAYDRLPV